MFLGSTVSLAKRVFSMRNSRSTAVPAAEDDNEAQHDGFKIGCNYCTMILNPCGIFDNNFPDL